MHYTIRFWIEVPAPAGSEFEAVEMYKEAEVPFLPRQGDFVGVETGDDEFVVDDVHWNPSDGFVVCFEPASVGVEYMKGMGWKEGEQ